MDYTSNVTSPPQGWSLSPNHTFTRPLDEVETWFSITGAQNVALDRDAVAIALGLKLKLPGTVVDPVPYLRRAWLVLWYKHPMLSAKYPSELSQEKAHRQPVTIGPLSSAEWAQTFVVQNDDLNLYDNTDNVTNHRNSHMMPTLHWFPIASELFIRLAHRRIDGFGLLKLGNTMMRILASVIHLGLDADISSYDSDVQHPTLNPGVSRGFDDETSHSEAASIQKVVKSLNDDWGRTLAGPSLPLRKGSENRYPTRSHRLCYEFGTDMSKAIHKSCKDQGISIAAALHTSLIRVILSSPHDDMSGDMAVSIITDLRKFLHSCYFTPEHTVGVNTSYVPFCINDIKRTDISFAQLAGKVADIYACDLTTFFKDDKGKPLQLMKVLRGLLGVEESLPGASETDSPAVVSPIKTSLLSSVGLFERHIQRDYEVTKGGNDKIEIEDSYIGFDMALPWLMFHAYTFRDTLRVQVSYNESYYDKGFLRIILESIKRELVMGLNIKPTKL